MVIFNKYFTEELRVRDRLKKKKKDEETLNKRLFPLHLGFIKKKSWSIAELNCT